MKLEEKLFFLIVFIVLFSTGCGNKGGSAKDGGGDQLAEVGVDTEVLEGADTTEAQVVDVVEDEKVEISEVLDSAGNELAELVQDSTSDYFGDGSVGSEDGSLDILPETIDVTIDVSPEPHPDYYPEMIELPPDIPFDFVLDMVFDIPVEPIDAVIEIPCTPQGCTAYRFDSCCPGLIARSECDPSSGLFECLPLYCVNCGDSVCGPHETCYNCASDCRTPCTEGDYQVISCSMIETQHCRCVGAECHPECRMDAGGIMGWYDSCTGSLIRADGDCSGEVAVCRAICSRSEGWYESGSGELITWESCSPVWVCETIW